MQWSSNLAYAIGLLTTDGCLSSDDRHIDLTSKDFKQISLFAKILNLKNKIGTKTNGSSTGRYFRIQFGNVKFYRFLLKIGLTPNKSRTLGSLAIPDRYFCDFTRGHLDGDGNIMLYIDKYNFYKNINYTNNRAYVRFISASRDHISWLQGKITSATQLRGALFFTEKPNISTIWSLKFSKKESIKLLKWIYYKNNLPCLERKRKLALKILAILTTEKRKAYTKIARKNYI